MKTEKRHKDIDREQPIDINPDLIRDDARDVGAAFMRESAPRFDADREWQRFLSLRPEAACDVQEKPSPRATFRWLYAFGGAVAGIAACLIILFSLGFFTKPEIPQEEDLVLFAAVKQDGRITMTSSTPTAETSKPKTHTAPQKNVETANKPVYLDTEVLDMRKVSVTSVFEERTVTTPRGKRIRIILADGTEVTLNGESSLRFPARFVSDRRTVNLEGEAYFAVAHDENHPFIVISDKISTTALGTEFDVRAYNRADVRVSLLSGKVLVLDMTDKSSVTLDPGQDVTLKGGKLVVSNINNRELDAWRDGFFYFDNVPLIDVMIELGRWYNVNVGLSDRTLMSYRLHFVADRNEPVESIVESLNTFGTLIVTFDGTNIRISPTK